VSSAACVAVAATPGSTFAASITPAAALARNAPRRVDQRSGTGLAPGLTMQASNRPSCARNDASRPLTPSITAAEGATSPWRAAEASPRSTIATSKKNTASLRQSPATGPRCTRVPGSGAAASQRASHCCAASARVASAVDTPSRAACQASHCR
jgi:hypothetical protein